MPTLYRLRLDRFLIHQSLLMTVRVRDSGAVAPTRRERRARPSWRALPRGAKVFRIAHVAWGVVALSALAHIWASAFRRHRDRALWASTAFLLVQGVALGVGRGDCPFGHFQRRLGDPVPMFELVVPPRAAKAAIPILFVVAVTGMGYVGLRPPLRRP